MLKKSQDPKDLKYPFKRYHIAPLKYLILSLHEKLCVPTIKIHAQFHAPSYQFKCSWTNYKVQERRYSSPFYPPHVDAVAGGQYCYGCYVTSTKTGFFSILFIPIVPATRTINIR